MSTFTGARRLDPGYAYVSSALNCGNSALLTSPSSTLGGKPSSWVTSDKQSDVLPLRLYVAPSDTQSAFLNYSYAVAETQDIDAILRIEYDPTVLSPGSIQQTMIETLRLESGPGRAGEHWIRIRGQLPKGSGPLVHLSFRILKGGPQEQWGTLTIFH